MSWNSDYVDRPVSFSVFVPLEHGSREANYSGLDTHRSGSCLTSMMPVRRSSQWTQFSQVKSASRNLIGRQTLRCGTSSKTVPRTHAWTIRLLSRHRPWYCLGACSTRSVWRAIRFRLAYFTCRELCHPARFPYRNSGGQKAAKSMGV